MLFVVITGINNLLLSVLFPNTLLHDDIALFIVSVNFVYSVVRLRKLKLQCTPPDISIHMSSCDKP